MKLSRTGVSVQCLDQQNQFDLLGEAVGVKAVGRRGGGVLPDLGLGVYERYTRYVSSPREKAWSLCWVRQTHVFVSALCLFY